MTVKIKLSEIEKDVKHAEVAFPHPRDEALAATLRAAAALVRIARLALELRAAGRRAANARYIWARADSDDPGEAPLFEAVVERDREVTALQAEYDAALGEFEL
jgi:hypothetical protein